MLVGCWVKELLRIKYFEEPIYQAIEETKHSHALTHNKAAHAITRKLHPPAAHRAAKQWWHPSLAQCAGCPSCGYDEWLGMIRIRGVVQRCRENSVDSWHLRCIPLRQT